MTARPSRDVLHARAVLLLRSLLAELHRHPVALVYARSSTELAPLLREGEAVLLELARSTPLPRPNEVAFCETCGHVHEEGSSRE